MLRHMPKNKEKLAIIDGNALLHRAWHALPPLTTKDGKLINAAYGFNMILLKVFKELKPDYVAVAFDKKTPTFRHEMYEEYKATREKQPEELYDQLPIIKDILKAFNIPIYEKEKYEADDLIGTICEKKSVDNPDTESIIVTGDLDALQLVDYNTKVFTLKRGITDTVVYDDKAVKERYDLSPEQLIDYKALRGDPSDNIPGVPGIGEKTAINLLKEFGSLGKIYEILESDLPEAKLITDKIKNLLIEHKDKAFMSKELATILRDAPIDFNIKDAKFGKFDREKIVKLFQELEFKTLLNKIPKTEKQGDLFGKENKGENDKSKKKQINSGYKLINLEKDFKKFLQELKKQKSFALDTETDDIDAFKADLLGISFCWKDGRAYYVVKNKGWLKKLKPILEDLNIKKYGHNIKYDLAVLEQEGMDVRPISFDTMVASYLLNPGSRAHKLDDLVFSELGYEMMPIKELIGKGKNQISMSEVPVEEVAQYSCEDADYTWRLVQKLKPKLKEKNQLKLFKEIEMPLIPVLEEMEKNGFKLDNKFISQLSKKISQKLNDLTKKIYKMAGQEFNINSPIQLKEILFEKLKIPTYGLGKTKTGFSTAASELEKMRGRHKIIDLIIDYRELAKLKNTYLDALPKLVNPKTGRVHTNFNQTITATGRLSSSNPNLQNIPMRTETGRQIRKAFIAEKGNKIISADYSQIELRVIASIANDRKMIEAFRRGEDIHTRTAAEIWNIEPKKVSYEMRRAAKAINFGVSYGMGVFGLVQSAGISRQEAQQFIDKYFDLHSGIKKYIENTKEKAHKEGFVETLFGRRRYLPEIESSLPQMQKAAERMAINMPIQGTAADIIKLAMIEIYKNLPKICPKCKIILQVHDELVFEVPEKDIEKAAEFIKEKMESIYKLKAPVIVDVEVGNNWGELEEFKS